MQDLLKLQQRIVPELLDLLEKRYTILKTINDIQPIGRRVLSNYIGIGERIVRTEVNFLKQQNLIDINPLGMTITPEGKEVIEKLKDIMQSINGLSELELKLKQHFGLKHIIIVPGDLDENNTVLSEIGRKSASYISNAIKDNSIIALTGGSTIKEVIDNIQKLNDYKNILVVPARGGIGRNVETLANTLAAKMAKKLNASYKLLHFPDNLSDAALDSIINEKDIKEVVDNIRNSDMIVFGIGRAYEMALRRGLSKSEIEKILNLGAVAEAFGYYFNSEGKIVYSTSTIRVRYEDIQKIDTLIAVAGGKNKAEAICAVCKNNSNNIVLITDEGAARSIIELIS